MAYTFDEVQKKLGAEIVAGNLICGILENRVFVGKTNEDGVFEITPEGKAMIEALKEPTKPVKEPTEKPKAEKAVGKKPGKWAEEEVKEIVAE